MKLLDLFCGAGGAAQGYFEANFTHILGVDIEPQPNYPFEFVQGDALQFDLEGYDLIHASPPCNRWSSASGKSMSRRRELYPDLLRPIRSKLEGQNTPYVIENVEGSPLHNPILLCGTMFPSLRVIRHRLFECSFFVPQPTKSCNKHPTIVSWSQYTKGSDDPYVTVAGGGKAPLQYSRIAMGIDWMNQRELSQAIPPPYTRYIGGFVTP